MDAQNAGAAAADEAPQQDGMMGGMMRSMLMFMALQSGTRMLFGSPQEASVRPRGAPAAPGAAPPAAPREESALEKWAKARLPPQPKPAPKARSSRSGASAASYDYAKTNGRSRTFTFTTENATRCVRRAWENVSVYAHVFATTAEDFDPRQPGPATPAYSAALTKFHKPPKNQTGRSLLSNETVDAAPAANASDARPILYWKPTSWSAPWLAFKNNAKFWRNKKTPKGCPRTIALNCVFQLVILLYLLDNDTSWMILISSSMGLFTEVWKLSKAVKVRRDPDTGHWGVHCEESYAVSETKEYDDIATRHLLRVVAPLLLGYSAYSLVTGRHKGWYSWLVGSCVGFIYAFGFVMMTPQLYINYRLKSVEHLPWRAMVYKSLNTFIDDLFAFIIKMPTMHRLSCLRDDVIFVATLYQRYIYRVDYTRINEFGQGGVDPDADKVEAESRGRPRPRTPSWSTSPTTSRLSLSPTTPPPRVSTAPASKNARFDATRCHAATALGARARGAQFRLPP
ncbi:apoptotic process [Aureococcus anophagefferens]|nr:apoptotic process [Aureococcus anophagefferens]